MEQTLYIESGSPWEDGYNASFDGRLRDELLDRAILCTLQDAQVLIDRRRQEYNTIRPHGALNYRPSTPEAILPSIGVLFLASAGSATASIKMATLNSKSGTINPVQHEGG